MVIQREKWNGKYVYVAREKGKVVCHVKAQGSNTNLKQLEEKYKEYGSFNTDYKTTRLKLSKVTLISQVKETTLKDKDKGVFKSPPRRRAMYSVEGEINGYLIVANSQIDEDITPREKKSNAWKSFLMRVDEYMTGGYDENEGLKYVDSVHNLKEGWVYYV